MSEVVKIRFSSHFLGYSPGDVVEVDMGYARLLVEQGRARLFPDSGKMVEGNKDKMMRKCKTK